jgi:outer membrane protein assembly factor BamE (lipoprotein component of BamABCDE complex)
MKPIRRIEMSAIGVALLFSLTAGCATFPEKQEETKSPLSAGNVSMTIKKGITTKADVLKVFGSPNIVTKNRNADEVWNYNRMNFTTRVGEDGGSLIFWGGSRAVSTATTKSFDLMITFDLNDVVKDYSIIQASF